MRASRAIRATAWTVVAAGVAAPLLRRRLGLGSPAVLGAAAAAPVALSVVVPRSRARDVAICCFQMWAYMAAYEMPNDDPEALEQRVRIGYPIAIDRLIGLGTPPGLRLQRGFSDPTTVSRFEKVLVWAHWSWFFVPHGTAAYVLLRDRDRFERAAVQTYAVFDLGVIAYWVIPTAPPWYAAAHGHLDRFGGPAVRRMMLQYGEQFWRQRWAGLYDFLGGNPLAAMPSLHFATSVMAAHLLSEVGPLSGAVGWTYALTLGLALIYLGEHYVADLLAGLALTEGVRAATPLAAPVLERLSAAVRTLEGRAAA